MYTGYLAMSGDEVINTHRANAYARTAGLPWLKGCDCDSIGHSHNQTYLSPMLDADAGNPPPWWDEERRHDSSRFFGVVGVEFAGISDSTRSVVVSDTNSVGGYIGSLRFRQRTTTVRALLIGADDCAVNLGIEWLRSIDTINVCSLSTMEVYSCCPCLCGDECDDPVCQEQCVDTAKRLFYDSRVVTGPTILTEHAMSVGYMAEVEFVIVSADPQPYTVPVVVEVFSTDLGFPHLDPEPSPEPSVDAFGLPVAGSPRTVLLEPQTTWRRSVHEVSLEGEGLLDPILVVHNVFDEAAGDVRVHVAGPRGEFAFRLPFLPGMSSVELDFMRRKVFTVDEAGERRLNSAFAYGPDGALIRWPQQVRAGEFTVTVDVLPWSPNVTLEVHLSRVGMGA
jgi:hypothetical protein